MANAPSCYLPLTKELHQVSNTKHQIQSVLYYVGGSRYQLRQTCGCEGGMKIISHSQQGTLAWMRFPGTPNLGVNVHLLYKFL